MAKGNENDKSANFLTENKKGPRNRYIKTKGSILYSDNGPLTHDVITCSIQYSERRRIYQKLSVDYMRIDLSRSIP